MSFKFCCPESPKFESISLSGFLFLTSCRYPVVVLAASNEGIRTYAVGAEGVMA